MFGQTDGRLPVGEVERPPDLLAMDGPFSPGRAPATSILPGLESTRREVPPEDLDHGNEDKT